MFKKIMVATDGSQTSIRTAELAVGLARLSGGSIIAIYVVDVHRLAHLPGYAAFPSLGKSGADLLVLGRIGRSDLEKIMLGCVAEKVVRHSKIPVLIVPAMSK